MIRSSCYFLLFLILFVSPHFINAESTTEKAIQSQEKASGPLNGPAISEITTITSGFDKIFKTKYSHIYYSRDEHIDTFIWRLGGQRREFMDNTELASNRVDRIVNRVQTILDMWPDNFKVNIYLHPQALGPNKVAYYEYKTASLHFALDYASDGVVAHEMAHAIVNQYFPSRAPSKMQEILSQYVDEHLWSDY